MRVVRKQTTGEKELCFMCGAAVWTQARSRGWGKTGQGGWMKCRRGGTRLSGTDQYHCSRTHTNNPDSSLAKIAYRRSHFSSVINEDVVIMTVPARL